MYLSVLIGKFFVSIGLEEVEMKSNKQLYSVYLAQHFCVLGPSYCNFLTRLSTRLKPFNGKITSKSGSSAKGSGQTNRRVTTPAGLPISTRFL